MEYYTDIKFAICGGGPYKNSLMTLAAEMNLKNVVFLPLVPTEELNSLLNMADMHLVVQKNTENELFFPSKLSTILAVGGIAIVTAAVDSSLYRMMSSDNMGILIQPENKDEFVSAIIDNIYSDQNEEKSLNARGYAEKYLHH